ncbi:unnamed protein product [Candidula unifasciata]|uniref:Proteasome assembly chaperone 2 n=1 Tax=Candidula unifasciata TaxID=100452 RepID=A0A8S3ZJH2_9EUPU|nr:unnamed protein product [Candidula unifasciata]
MFIPSRQQDWHDFTLILPTVSVGNVGQLAADLIISTLHLERVGYVLHPSLLPVIGSNPYADDDDSASYKLTTSCEVFESVVSKIVVIQQRAPVIKKIYADWLSDWIKSQHFRQVVVLTSSFAQDRLDHQISGSPFRILLSPVLEEQEGEFFKTKLEWVKLEPRQPNPAFTQIQSPADSLPGNGYLHMPGSGIAKLVFDNCQELPVLVLLMFVSEGDNALDAVAVADQINKWLSLLPNQDPCDTEEPQGHLKRRPVTWKIPRSWRLVFGSTYEPKLFH